MKAASARALSSRNPARPLRLGHRQFKFPKQSARAVFLSRHEVAFFEKRVDTIHPVFHVHPADLVAGGSPTDVPDHIFKVREFLVGDARRE